MSQEYESAIKSLRREIADRMRTVNELCKVMGRAPIYPDADGGTAVAGGIRPDQWYRSGLSTAVREFLEMRKLEGLGPASIDDIFSALDTGGFQFENRDVPTAKAALKQSLTKNSLIFHRLPNGHYGLNAWYPGIKESLVSEEKAAKKQVRRKSDDGSAPSRRDNGLFKNSGTETVRDVVKRAIKAMPEQFTKLDVFGWIESNTSLRPSRQTVFVTVTRLRDELNLITEQESKGREPSVYRKNGSSNGVAEHGRTKQAVGA